MSKSKIKEKPVLEKSIRKYFYCLDMDKTFSNKLKNRETIKENVNKFYN
jgi:hypothetical protein